MQTLLGAFQMAHAFYAVHGVLRAAVVKREEGLLNL